MEGLVRDNFKIRQLSSLRLDELQAALKGRGVAMLLLLLALPFCLVPVPGLSTAFGIAVLLIAKSRLTEPFVGVRFKLTDCWLVPAEELSPGVGVAALFRAG